MSAMLVSTLLWLIGAAPGLAGGPLPAGVPLAAEAGMAVRAAGGEVARNQDAETILNRAAERHRRLRTLQASFTQRIRNPILERDESSSGVFSFQAPLRYRIEFSEPPEDVVVSTGERVWIYLPSTQPGQVIVSSVGPRTRGLAPYQFLYEVRDRYDAALLGEEDVSARPAYHLVLTPRSDEAEYARAEIWIDKETFLTRQTEVEERNGVVRRFTLERHRADAALDERLFHFTPPRGIEVFEQ